MKIRNIIAIFCAATVIFTGIASSDASFSTESESCSDSCIETIESDHLEVIDCAKKAVKKTVTKKFERVPKQSGWVYITDKITFSYDGKKIYSPKIKQAADEHFFGYHKSGTKIDKAAKDGTVTVHSTYYTKELVTGFVSKLINKDIDFGLKYQVTYNYKLYPNGTVKKLATTNKKFKIYEK